MTTAIFAFGIFVFLVTVYGTVVAGGLFLTERQLVEEPELAPDPTQRGAGPDSAKDGRLPSIPSDY